MTAAFIVQLEVSSTLPEDLQLDAADLLELLEREGYPVTSVLPWSRQEPTLSPTTYNPQT